MRTFNLDTKLSPSSLLVRAKKAAYENDAALLGDERSGRFSRDMARGEYRTAPGNPAAVDGRRSGFGGGGQVPARPRRDPGATERALASALGEVAAERERLVRLYTTGRLGDAEYDTHAAELGDREASARAELERARGEAERAKALEENRRAVLEAFGAGLQLGLFYFPPVLRRQVYGALGLAVVVFPDGSVEVEGHFDAEAIRLTREVEEHALALREAAGRANATPLTDVAEGWERLEHELIRVRNERTPRPSRPVGRV